MVVGRSGAGLLEAKEAHDGEVMKCNALDLLDAACCSQTKTASRPMHRTKQRSRYPATRRELIMCENLQPPQSDHPGARKLIDGCMRNRPSAPYIPCSGVPGNTLSAESMSGNFAVERLVRFQGVEIAGMVVGGCLG